MLTRLLKRDSFVLVILLIMVLLIAMPTLAYPLGRDQGEFATIGRGILNGRVPYTDLWNPKPPAVFYVYALAMWLFGQSAEALRAIDFIIVPVISATLFWIGRHISNRRVGLWAALLFPVFYFTETFWTLTQNDGIALLPMVLAVASGLKAASNQLPVAGQDNSARFGRYSTLLWSFWVGTLCGYVVWFKYPFALLGLMLVVWNGGIRWRTRLILSPQRSDLYVALAFITGGLLGLGGGATYLMSMEAWNELIRSAQVTAQYTALTFNTSDFTSLMGTALYFRWQQWGLLMVLAVVGSVVVIIGRRTPKQADKNMSTAPDLAINTRHSLLSTQHVILLLMWLLAAFAMMLVQGKGYDYHWLPMLPPMVLLGAMGVEWVIERMRYAVPLQSGSMHMLLNGFVALAFLLIMALNIWPKTWAYLSGREEQTAYFDRFVAGAADEFSAGDSLRVANLLREQVAVGDSLYIWGFRPEVYFLSGLNPATRFIFHFPLVGSWYPPEWRQENVDMLWAALPPYVLVLQVDYMPWVTGTNEDSNTLLQGYTELNNWLIFNYERDTQIGHFFVWRRKF